MKKQYKKNVAYKVKQAQFEKNSEVYLDGKLGLSWTSTKHV